MRGVSFFAYVKFYSSRVIFIFLVQVYCFCAVLTRIFNMPPDTPDWAASSDAYERHGDEHINVRVHSVRLLV